MPYSGSSCKIDKNRRITLPKFLLSKSNIKSDSIVFILHDSEKKIIRIENENNTNESDKILDCRTFDGSRVAIPISCTEILGCNKGDTIVVYLQGTKIFLQGI